MSASRLTIGIGVFLGELAFIGIAAYLVIKHYGL